jgi:hypothetical protein
MRTGRQTLPQKTRLARGGLFCMKAAQAFFKAASRGEMKEEDRQSTRQLLKDGSRHRAETLALQLSNDLYTQRGGRRAGVSRNPFRGRANGIVRRRESESSESASIPLTPHHQVHWKLRWALACTEATERDHSPSAGGFRESTHFGR